MDPRRVRALKGALSGALNGAPHGALRAPAVMLAGLVAAVSVVASGLTVPAAAVVHGRDGGVGDTGSAIIIGTALEWQRDGDLDQAHFCGGTLVGPRIVVTAAHCVRGRGAGELVAGYVASGDRRDQDALVRRVSRVVVHPDFNNSTLVNDIAVLHLGGPMTGVPVVIPARAADAALTAAGATVQAAGWGRLGSGAGYPDVVQLADLTVFPDTSCGEGAERYRIGDVEFRPWPSDEVFAELMLCAIGIDVDRQVVDTCVGDSGGPLTGGTGDGLRLVGLVSWGPQTCAEDAPAQDEAGRPGVYTRLSAYEEFLTEQGVTYTRPVLPSTPVISKVRRYQGGRAFVTVNEIDGNGLPLTRSVVRCRTPNRSSVTVSLPADGERWVRGLRPKALYTCRVIVTTDAGSVSSETVTFRAR